MSKIYTKTGDRGETSLYAKGRVYKDNPIVEAMGAVDECNAAIGAAISTLPKELITILGELSAIQHALFDIGAALATPLSKSSEENRRQTHFNAAAVEMIEQWIDRMEEQLPQLTYFILPGGHLSASMIHVARATCRRAERRMISLYKQAEIDHEVFVYINRLSDYLFVLSRYVNYTLGQAETRWQRDILFRSESS